MPFSVRITGCVLYDSLTFGLAGSTGAQDSVELTAKFQQARAYHQHGELMQAQAIYEEILRIKPTHFDALNYKGLALKALNRPEQALASFNQAIVLRPRYVEAHYNRGNLLLELRRFDEALPATTVPLPSTPTTPRPTPARHSCCCRAATWTMAGPSTNGV